MSSRSKALLANTSDVLRVEYKQGQFKFSKTIETRKRRFMAKVDTSAGPDACWRWLGSRQQANGYGQISDISPTTGNPTMRSAHRVSYEIDRGVILSPRQYILHAKGCPKDCTNPRHLRIGTAAENTADARAEGTLKSWKLDGDKVRKIVSLKRDHGVEVWALSERFGISMGTVSKVLKGVTWSGETGIVNVPRRPGRPPNAARLAA